MNLWKREWTRQITIVLLYAASCSAAFASDTAHSNEDRIELQEIVVTGSRLRQADEPTTVTVFDEAKIAQLGVSSVSDLLRYLPQAPYLFHENYAQGGAQSAQLRGLGVDSTLVLINGRRTVASSVNAATNAFDLNTIPLSAVDRVEVLADSASAVYGADAVGGVVNVVLKQDVPRPRLDASIGSADGGGRERRTSMAAGYAGDRLHLAVVADYFDRDYLLGAERERWRDQDFRRYGGSDYRSTNTNPANISSRTTANLPGLPSRVATVPEGSTGVGLRPEDFLETAGNSNLDSLFAYRSIVSDAQRRSAVLSGEYALAPQLSLFAEGMAVNRVTRTQGDPASLSGTRVPASNAFNPFGVDVSVNYLFTGLGPRESVAKAELRRGVLGLRGSLGQWEWEVSGLYTHEQSSTWTENAVDAARVAASLASSDPATALNVFQDGPGGSASLLDSLLSTPISRIESEGRQISGFIRGPLWTLPAGELQVVVGGESRREAIDFDSIVIVQHARDVTAAFVEARVPLVNAEWQWPLVHSLSLTLAGRHDDYDDFGTTFNPQYQVLWRLSTDWSINGSYGTSFRAPALFELYGPRFQAAGAVITDPRRNGETVPVNVISGGNPDLGPVEATSWNAGIAFSPTALPGWRFTGTYWHTVMDGRVALFSQQLLLANEALFPSRVIRQAATPADIAAGVPGVVTTIDTTRINFGTLVTDGVDLAMAATMHTRDGLFGAELTGTWVDRYSSVQIPATPAIDRVGIASFEGTIPRWRATANLHGAVRGWGLAATFRYLPSYEDRTILGVNRDRRVSAQTLVDLQASLDVAQAWGEQSWASGLRMSVGVINAFDEAPEFSEIVGPLGFDQSQGDLRQRFGYLRLSYEF